MSSESTKNSPIDHEELIRSIFTKLGDVEEGTSYATLAYRVKGTLLARLHQGGEHLVLKVGYDAKEALLDLGSATFTTKPHYDGTDYVLIALDKIKSREADAVIREAYEQLATPRSTVKTSIKRVTKTVARKTKSKSAKKKRAPKKS